MNDGVSQAQQSTFHKINTENERTYAESIQKNSEELLKIEEERRHKNKGVSMKYADELKKQIENNKEMRIK